MSVVYLKLEFPKPLQETLGPLLVDSSAPFGVDQHVSNLIPEDHWHDARFADDLHCNAVGIQASFFLGKTPSRCDRSGNDYRHQYRPCSRILFSSSRETAFRCFLSASICVTTPLRFASSSVKVLDISASLLVVILPTPWTVSIGNEFSVLTWELYNTRTHPR